MKSAQWIALLVLALMVGGVTFVMVYLGGSKPPETPVPIEELPTISFAVKKVPLEGFLAPTSEVNEYGHQDFWFENNAHRDLTVGLIEKGCTCSQVGMALVPESRRAHFAADAGVRMLQRSMCGLDGLPRLMATYQPEALFPEVPESEVKFELMNLEDGVPVPAGALGWIRLSWRREQPIPLRTHATLWVDRRIGLIKLDVEAKIAAPIEVNKEIPAGVLDYRDLTAGRTFWIYCWSVTRPKFEVKVEALRDNVAVDSDPIELGEPEPMTSDGMRRIEKVLAELSQLKVTSAYRIPITIKEKARDGTPLEWGHFRRFYKVSSPDAPTELVPVELTGEVRGDVAVLGGAKEAGGINLGPFPSRTGAHGEIVLETEEPGMILELDKARNPSFMKVQFPSEPETAPTNPRLRRWKVRVDVPPHAASGSFPRSDDAVYRDSAIYVRAKDANPKNSPHVIRVPVYGTANAG